MRLLKKVKGQAISLESLVFVAILLVVITLILSFGTKITEEIGESFLSTTAVSNETQAAWTTSTPVEVDNAHKERFSLDTTAADIVVHNASSDEFLFPASNYTFDANGTIFWLEATEDASSKNISYTYTAIDSVEGSVMTNGSNALVELSSWLPLIALILAAAVIIGLITVYFFVRGT